MTQGLLFLLCLSASSIGRIDIRHLVLMDVFSEQAALLRLGDVFGVYLGPFCLDFGEKLIHYFFLRSNITQ